MKSFFKFKGILKLPALLFVVICGLLMACGSSDTKYTVIFESNGGNVIEAQSVVKGQTAKRPLNPIRNNYEFDSWYSDAALTIVYDFISKITGNITLYAKWIGNSFEITFNNNLGSGGPTAIETRYGSPMAELTVNSQPIRIGHYFTGYFDAATEGTKYYNADLTSARNWDKANIAMLYAQWDVLPEMEMVLIPAGTFLMGSPTTEAWRNSDELQREVTLTNSFHMGKYLVTQEQFIAVMGKNISFGHGGPGREPAAGEEQKRRPVDFASWYDVIVFCNKLSLMEGLTPAYRINGKLDPADWGPIPNKYIDGTNDAIWDAVEIVVGSTGYRLPTEAQWEYACRAGTTTAYNTGETISNDTGWYVDNSDSKSHEVGKKPANNWGLYDMHGNLWQWCWDWYGPYASDDLVDPFGPISGSSRVWRGGAWTDHERGLRSAYRGSRAPTYTAMCLGGFRVVLP